MQKISLLCLLGAIAISSPIPIDPSEYEIIELVPISTNERPTRSLKTDFGTPLTGMERITRSLKTEDGFPLTGMEKITKRSLDLDRERRQIFLPGFARHRQARSLDEEDLDREKRQIFLPAFARHRQARSVFLPSFSKSRRARSVDALTDILDSNDVFKRERRHVFLPTFAQRRQGRSLRDEENEDMDTAETAVFLPAFARRG
ncbi:uncharacterized protein LOC107398350 [Tribolium castaneum]|uniref:Short neuropeptide F n=1 Tax=Tribolium castaneum TaxID=7070 RepID=D6WPX4_TRICA|nr:hypothetical protein TcasGA2_TC009006 [Tribolium castaneum]